MSTIRLTEGITIDCDLQGVWRDDQLIPLPVRTWAILAYLVRHPNTVIHHEQLLAFGWPGEPRVADDLVRHIHRIRRAIERSPRQPAVLLTRRGAGYWLRFSDAKLPLSASAGYIPAYCPWGAGRGV